MINKFRWKFIAITMTAIILVLSGIIFTVNVFNFSNATKFADTILNYLADNNGQFPGPLPEVNPENPDEAEFITEESPYDTRFFTVTFVNDTPTTVNVRYITMSAEKAIQIATNIYDSNQKQGYKDYLRFLVKANDDGSTMVLAMDNQKMIRPMQTLINISAIVACGGIVVSFIIVLLVSKWVVYPFVESDKKQKRFITDAGHELKTPLTIISANSELIEMTNGQTEETDTINKQVARMTDIVKSLTTLAKINEYEKPNFKEIVLTDVVIDSAGAFKAAYQTENKELKLDIDENIKVHVDESNIRKILSILLDNALKYSLTYTSITLHKERSHAELIISNDATKIATGNLDKAFDRFYRSDEARGSTIEGSGIGLSIAKELANYNKLKITAYGSENSIFNIKIIF